MRVVYCARTAMSAFLSIVETDEREHGGVLIGRLDAGVFHFVPAPNSAARTRGSIAFDGPFFDRALRELREQSPGLEFLGFGHSHYGLSSLSSGDHAQLNALHAGGQLPARGLLVLLAVRNRGARTIVRAWQSTAANVTEEIALAEVDDPMALSSAALAPTHSAPHLPPHRFGTDLGARRFELELADLEARGFAVSATVEGRGVSLILGHTERVGRLKVDVAAEGWDRLPRVSVEENGRQSPVIGALAPLGSVWSSAWSLGDLVDYVVERRLWRRPQQNGPTLVIDKVEETP